MIKTAAWVSKVNGRIYLTIRWVIHRIVGLEVDHVIDLEMFQRADTICLVVVLSMPVYSLTLFKCPIPICSEVPGKLLPMMGTLNQSLNIRLYPLDTQPLLNLLIKVPAMLRSGMTQSHIQMSSYDFITDTCSVYIVFSSEQTSSHKFQSV